MRLFDAIVDANHRAVAGDANAGVRVADFENELPVIALTCIDPRLNPFFPNVLGLPPEQFIWLRNAGNIITGPMSSTMRSLALACAIKGGREIAIIGHTDCQVSRATAMQLISRFQAVGVERGRLPDNLTEFFGMSGSERQNVIRACDFVRQSPLIGAKVPVHGLLADIATGKMEWIVNGYNAMEVAQARSSPPATEAFIGMAPFQMGEMKFPEQRIGDAAGFKEWLAHGGAALESPGSSSPIGSTASPQLTPKQAPAAQQAPSAQTPEPAPKAQPPVPPRMPLPPPIKPRLTMKRGR
ncbi:MAG: carbonic anhydrase [Verrucomicrobiota bacterium]